MLHRIKSINRSPKIYLPKRAVHQGGFQRLSLNLLLGRHLRHIEQDQKQLLLELALCESQAKVIVLMLSYIVIWLPHFRGYQQILVLTKDDHSNIYNQTEELLQVVDLNLLILYLKTPSQAENHQSEDYSEAKYHQMFLIHTMLEHKVSHSSWRKTTVQLSKVLTSHYLLCQHYILKLG